MKIEKRPSGAYRIRKMYKGQMYTVTFDYKPTQKEAMQAMANELDKIKSSHTRMTFLTAAGSYVDMKRNVLSPRTVKEYAETAYRFPDWFLQLPVSDITQIDINRLVNELSIDRSPKTVRNYHGFLTAVLGTFCPHLKISTTLPQKIKNEPYTPSQEDVRRILEEIKGSAYEVPITLACYGMRRSEICALTPDDIEGDIVHITKAIVQNDQREWVLKTTKTVESTRSIIIPSELAEKIRSQGYVYKGHPGRITKYLEKAEDRLGIPRFPLHKLRHYFASQMSALGVPEADLLKMGGWRTDHVMKSVYRHSMMDKEENAKREAAEKLRNALFS
ncbi:MAG: tyrosine-type recombinase/integrase [Bacteroidales bacterium]|nr:tyrosine-type recombinase/integrase [Lachnoclostridium sp.]MCM1385160.1 tyrosine-type recombinase/integrase [Lachnoclostridium sp.]MCM1465562.1 tyrosine-type recombinase/integrase [Bacteroidales bacterium]